MTKNNFVQAENTNFKALNIGCEHWIEVQHAHDTLTLDKLFKDQKIQLIFIQPGKPMKNGYFERLMGSLRKEFINAYLFW